MSETRDPSTDQPLPTPSDRPAVWEAVIDDMRARDQLGRKKYGTPLQNHNGRSALRDLYEELLDAAVYAKQRILEEGGQKTYPTYSIAGFRADTLTEADLAHWDAQARENHVVDHRVHTAVVAIDHVNIVPEPGDSPGSGRVVPTGLRDFAEVLIPAAMVRAIRGGKAEVPPLVKISQRDSHPDYPQVEIEAEGLPESRREEFSRCVETSLCAGYHVITFKKPADYTRVLGIVARLLRAGFRVEIAERTFGIAENDAPH